MEKEKVDAIKGGEFSFCSRCGDNCVVGKHNYMCTRCQCSFFGISPDNEAQLKIQYEGQVSRLTKKLRSDIANERIRQ
jgi:hypothetical protein